MAERDEEVHDEPSLVHVVDDDRSVRRTLAMVLRGRDHTVEEFESADAFLSALERRTPDCLVLDVRLPGMDGLELQSVLAGHGHDIPVVMITAHGDVPMAVRSMRAGAVDFLEKPFTGDAIAGAVQRALRRARRAPPLPLVPDVEERMASLTGRQREVMGLLVEGLRNKEIARRLDVSRRTVEAHRAEVLRKMGTASVAELVRVVLTTRA